MCSPLTFSGLSVGLTEGRDVVTLHGPGLEVRSEAKQSARAWLSSDKTFAMFVEFGTDDLVARISVRALGVIPADIQTRLGDHVSSRLDDRPVFGPAGVLRLGQAASAVRELVGEPNVLRTMVEWEYWTDYAPTECVASEVVIVKFADDRVVEFVFDGGG